ncbi:MAG: DoxX family protein [Pseudomonadota bacterium]
MSLTLQNSFTLVGRLLLAALFLPAGFSKLFGFAGTVAYINSVGLPFPEVAAVAALVVEIGAGLALLFGVGTRMAALALAGFTFVASFFFHNYWGVPVEQAYMQELMFFKNIAVAGGLLILAVNGPGAWSIENYLKSKSN